MHIEYRVVRTFENGLTGLMGTVWDSKEKAEKMFAEFQADGYGVKTELLSHPYSDEEYQMARFGGIIRRR